MKVCLQIVKNEKFKNSKSQNFKMWYNRQKKVGKIIVNNVYQLNIITLMKTFLSKLLYYVKKVYSNQLRRSGSL